MAISSELVSDVAGLVRYTTEWDAFAVAWRQPYCAPGWMLPWWRHAAPEGALLRVAIALDGDRLAGIAPFFADRSRTGLVRLRPLGAGTCARLGPLAAPGRDEDVAPALAAALAGAAPRPGVVALDEISGRQRWPELLAEGWPVAGARVERFGEIPAPGLELPTTGGFEGWLQSKSKNFRQQIRRGRRKLDKMGAEWRVSTEGDELSRDLESFARLHRARWSHKGGSGVLSGPIEQMLHDAAAELPGDRLRVYSIDVDGESISSQVFVGAGDELVYWNGGFDERFAAHHPALQTLVFAIEDAFTRGEGRVDLGAGAQDYKYRLASGEEKLEFARVVAPDALTRLRYAPERLRRSASGHLSDGQKTRIRALMRRSPA